MAGNSTISDSVYYGVDSHVAMLLKTLNIPIYLSELQAHSFRSSQGT